MPFDDTGRIHKQPLLVSETLDCEQHATKKL